jgi:hypothetical protein
MGFTPFFMVHGSKAVLPTDINYGSPQVQAYTEEGNQAALDDAIDQLNEVVGCGTVVLHQVPAGPTTLP